MLARADANQPQIKDRRSFQRVPISLYGRYMLPDRSEHECRVTDMSPGNMLVEGPASGEAGDRVIMYLDHVGRIEGTIERSIVNGFALDLSMSDRKRDKLAAQLVWLANKHELNLPEDRRHERVVPRNPHSLLTLKDGRQYRCRIIDLSLSGAALELDVRPDLGTPVTLGAMRGRVVRHFEEGIAIEFAFVQQEDTLTRFIYS